MERYPGSINPYCNHILHQEYPDRIGSPVFRKPLDMITGFHSFHHSLFHYGLNIRRTEQPAFDRRGFRDPELSVFGNISLPWYLFCLLEQFFKSNRCKAARFQKNPFRSAQKYVGPAGSIHTSPECNPSILYLRDFISQILDFSFQHRFQSEMTGSDPLQFLHKIFPSSQFVFFHITINQGQSKV